MYHDAHNKCNFSLLLNIAQFDDELEEVPSTHMPHLLSTTTFVQATIGETIDFPCAVDDIGDFVLIWKKEKNNILFASELRIIRDDRIKVNKTSLVISNIHPKDSGEYICQISTNPPLELSHSLDVLYPPSVKPHPRDGLITVKEGETVTLKCNATGNPKPSITWKHAGKHYDNGDGTVFHITNAEIDDSGEYECTADNSVGEPASAVITVEVVSAPKVYPEPKSGLVVVREGEEIAIGCEATGDPTPVITWKKPGADTAIKVREVNKIMISEADRNHAGSYECIANNSLGIFTSAIIRVQVLYAPEIKVPHSWIHAGEGTNVNISCMIHGEPVPSVMWKRNEGQTIHSNDHYRIMNNGHLHTLEIHHLTEEDFGGYKCVASNSLSSTSENVHIIGTPQVPKFTSKPHGSQGTKYTISWTVDSHTPVDEYSLMYRKKSSTGEWESKTIPATDKREGNMHSQVYQLVDLDPATSYEAVVTARNKFGWSKQSDALVFTTKSQETVESPITEETTTSSTTTTIVPPTVLENGTPITNDKHFEKVSSSSSTFALSLISLVPLAFISFSRNLL
ncbi:receptor-type tyrosine-protein phosphatase S [Trichonephila inaurata madagascariensis]|uniref:Receptor-type tyrosine-protein phosphatase S n=1 Tax=Trichonephila inaurata madagascariensis TaxID=2747483 RepID=A0A8X7BQM2_9ARAC|nr:receptor-type tyrosine-protein phosphatase S [Trichonephila inaurata madagascariensis]